MVSAEEGSTQVEVAFTEALAAERLWEAVDARATRTLVVALASGDRDAVDTAIGGGQLRLLPAVSDDDPQMRSHTTHEFLAGGAIAQQFSQSGISQDQGWIDTLFGHVKGEWPHLDKIRDPGELEANSNACPSRITSPVARRDRLRHTRRQTGRTR